MQITRASIRDANAIRDLYLHSFDSIEAETVARLDVSLLEENYSPKTLSYVVREDNKLIAHVAFSSMRLKDDIDILPLFSRPWLYCRFFRKKYWHFSG